MATVTFVAFFSLGVIVGPSGRLPDSRKFQKNNISLAGGCRALDADVMTRLELRKLLVPCTEQNDL